jgi:hypothetical protein
MIRSKIRIKSRTGGQATGKQIACGSHEGIDRKKANFGFTVAGAATPFKDLRVWEGRPNPAWEGTRAKLTGQKQ